MCVCVGDRGDYSRAALVLKLFCNKAYFYANTKPHSGLINSLTFTEVVNHTVGLPVCSGGRSGGGGRHKDRIRA